VGDTTVAVKGSMTVRIDCANTERGRSLDGDTGAGTGTDKGIGSVVGAVRDMADSSKLVGAALLESEGGGAAITVPRAERNVGGGRCRGSEATTTGGSTDTTRDV
jgi:hypothetical protein